MHHEQEFGKKIQLCYTGLSVSNCKASPSPAGSCHMLGRADIEAGNAPSGKWKEIMCLRMVTRKNNGLKFIL